MLLRRVISHFRKQEWTAIGLDFLIVVVGVFIGVQIGNANQSRQQKQLYEESFDRAIVEIHTNVEALERDREILKARLPVVQRALDVLRACRTDEDALAHLEAAFAPIGSAPGFRIDTKTLDQLINNDGFLPFQPPETRRQLRAMSTRLSRLSHNSESVVERAYLTRQDISHILQPGPLSMEGPDQIMDAIREGGIGSPELVRSRSLIVPLAQACEDKAFLNEFYSWEDMAYYHIVFGGLTAERARAGLEALGRPMPPAAEAAP